MYAYAPAIHSRASAERISLQANPRLANRRDDDDRLPIHWAVSYNRLPIVSQLIQTKNFDIDAQVRAAEGYRGVLGARAEIFHRMAQAGRPL